MDELELGSDEEDDDIEEEDDEMAQGNQAQLGKS
jgi:hypothetical protein